MVSRSGDAAARQSVIIDGVEAAGAAGSVAATLPVSASDVVTANGVGWTAGSCYYVPSKYVPVNSQYSTDEQLTGEVWIDGLPIYRKAFNAKLTESINSYQIIGNIGIECIPIKIGGSMGSTINHCVLIPYDAAISIVLFAASGNMGVYRKISGVANADLFLFVEYLKPL